MLRAHDYLPEHGNTVLRPQQHTAVLSEILLDICTMEPHAASSTKVSCALTLMDSSHRETPPSGLLNQRMVM